MSLLRAPSTFGQLSLWRATRILGAAPPMDGPASADEQLRTGSGGPAETLVDAARQP